MRRSGVKKVKVPAGSRIVKRYALPAAAVAVLCMALAAVVTAAGRGGAAEGPWPHDLDVELTALENGVWRLEYRLAVPVRRLDLGPTLGPLREENWRLETDGLALASRGGRDVVAAAKDGGLFREARFTVAPIPHGLAKDYEPIGLFAEGGAILYTGHFWPYTEDGARYDARFSVTPRGGERVSALGAEAPAFARWRSPLGHPAFIYAGRQRATGETVRALVDPSLPGWAKAEAAVLVPQLSAFFERRFARALLIEPDVFLAMGDASEPGRIRYSGDALPGQFMVTLSGGAWRDASPEARALLRQALAHEAAHLWQTAARPRGEDAPAWIHEGAADAMAVEALAALGLVEPETIAASLAGAKEECARELRGGSLLAAERAGRWRASYACGHALAAIAARARGPGETVIDFWRDFTHRAAAEGGYDTALFAGLVAAAAGPEFAREIALFERTAYAAPEKELARLLREADKAGAAGEARLINLEPVGGD